MMNKGNEISGVANAYNNARAKLRMLQAGANAKS
jgi:hypothetical protein